MILGEYFMSTADPGNIKVMLATEFNNFGKGASYRISTEHSLTVPLLRFLPT